MKKQPCLCEFFESSMKPPEYICINRAFRSDQTFVCLEELNCIWKLQGGRLFIAMSA